MSKKYLTAHKAASTAQVTDPYWNWVYTKNEGREPIDNFPDSFGLDDQDKEQPIELEAILHILNDGGLDELSPMQQRVFQLCVVEGITQTDASKQLHLTQQAISDHLSTGCKTLRDLAESRMKQLVQEKRNSLKEVRGLLARINKKG